MKFRNYGVASAIVTFAVVILAHVGVLGYYVYKFNIELSQQIKDCEELNPKYRNTYTPKTGPYEDVKFYAVEFRRTELGLITDEDSKTRYFLCGDLKEIQ